jgi:hypothetical protein
MDPNPYDEPLPEEEPSHPHAPFVPYRVQYGLAVCVAFLATVLTLTQGARVELALDIRTLAIIGIVQGVLTWAALLLPKIYRPPTDSRRGMD